jgi:hypothetical protein
LKSIHEPSERHTVEKELTEKKELGNRRQSVDVRESNFDMSSILENIFVEEHDGGIENKNEEKKIENVDQEGDAVDCADDNCGTSGPVVDSSLAAEDLRSEGSDPDCSGEEVRPKKKVSWGDDSDMKSLAEWKLFRGSQSPDCAMTEPDTSCKNRAGSDVEPQFNAEELSLQLSDSDQEVDDTVRLSLDVKEVENDELVAKSEKGDKNLEEEEGEVDMFDGSLTDTLLNRALERKLERSPSLSSSLLMDLDTMTSSQFIMKSSPPAESKNNTRRGNARLRDRGKKSKNSKKVKMFFILYLKPIL